MATIIIPRRHLAQPQGRVTLAPEWGSALEWERVLFSEGSYAPSNLVGSINSTTLQDFRWPGGAGEYGRFFGGLSGTSGQGSISGASLTATQSFSVVMSLRKRSSVAPVKNLESGARWYLTEAADSLVAAVRYVGDGSPVERISAPFEADESATFVYVREHGVGERLYKNGSLAGRFDTTLALVASATLGVMQSFHNTYLLGIGLGALPEIQAQSLSANPWQLFRADPIRIYSLPSGAITLGTPRFLRVTSSGFGVELDLS